jgi:hypothetical protein
MGSGLNVVRRARADNEPAGRAPAPDAHPTAPVQVGPRAGGGAALQLDAVKQELRTALQQPPPGP